MLSSQRTGAQRLSAARRSWVPAQRSAGRTSAAPDVRNVEINARRDRMNQYAQDLHNKPGSRGEPVASVMDAITFAVIATVARFRDETNNGILDDEVPTFLNSVLLSQQCDAFMGRGFTSAAPDDLRMRRIVACGTAAYFKTFLNRGDLKVNERTQNLLAENLRDAWLTWNFVSRWSDDSNIETMDELVVGLAHLVYRDVTPYRAANLATRCGVEMERADRLLSGRQ